MASFEARTSALRLLKAHNVDFDCALNTDDEVVRAMSTWVNQGSPPSVKMTILCGELRINGESVVTKNSGDPLSVAAPKPPPAATKPKRRVFVCSTCGGVAMAPA